MCLNIIDALNPESPKVPDFEDINQPNTERKLLISPLIDNSKARKKLLEINAGFIKITIDKPDTIIGVGFSKEQAILLGDRVYTDIASGYNAGIDIDNCILINSYNLFIFPYYHYKNSKRYSRIIICTSSLILLSIVLVSSQWSQKLCKRLTEYK